MKRNEAGDLLSFLAVAEAGGFTRAAARLGTSQSALSHTVRRLETALGLRLLARTTRKVTLTDAGERLLAAVRPAFDNIDAAVAALGVLREELAGLVRIATTEHAALTLLWPALAPLLRAHPDLQVELVVDSARNDIVAERLDAGVRLGEAVAKDMVATRIGPDLRMAVVGSPAYFAHHPAPRTPQDLAAHLCINLRLPTSGGLYSWELEKEGRELRVRVEGQLAFNNARMIIRAAEEGFGLACVLEDGVAEAVAAGRLVRVLADWCPPFSGYHLYYPSRRQPSAAFAAVVEALRSKG